MSYTQPTPAGAPVLLLKSDTTDQLIVYKILFDLWV